MKLSEFFEIVKPKYSYIKLTPNYSIRNNNTHSLAKTIASTYNDIFSSFSRDKAKLKKFFGREFLIGTKYNFNSPAKISYFIYIENKKVEFYFIVPKQYKSLIKEKISDVWGSVTDAEVDELPWFSDSAVKSQLVYKNKDALSLRTDRRSNELLNSNLNIIDVLEDNDKAGIFYNFQPVTQGPWMKEHYHAMARLKAKLPMERSAFNVWYIAKMASVAMTALLTDIVGSVKAQSGDNALIMALEGINKKGVSDETDKKATATVLNAQIVAISESQDRLRQMNNLRSLTNSFDAIRSDDNELTAKRHGKKFSATDYNIKTEVNKVSAEECQNFISLAGREILEKYSFIDQVNTQETQVPEELRKGVMCIGANTYRGEEQKAYLSEDPEYKNLSLIVIGPNRSGKSTLLGNLVVDSLKAGECAIVPDFIENCELSEEIAELLPDDEVLRIDCSNIDKAEGLGYNEIKPSTDIFEQYKNAKLQTSQLETLVNSINSEDKRLAPKMERYLQSAANVVFLSGGSIKDVFAVLQNNRERVRYLKLVPKGQYENMGEYMDSLRELDEVDKEGTIIGTKLHLIAGIIDRLNKLKSNAFMELMLKKNTSNNIDLVEEVQKSQLIIIQMPETQFPTDAEKNIITTYWMTKIWLAMQIRADEVRNKVKRKKVNLIIDELYQVENTERFLTEKLSRLPKFRLKPIISCHYLGQLKYIREELRSANASYMLIAGSDSKNYTDLKSKLYPYTEEDLGNLKRHESLNIIKTKNGEAKFITLLPSPIKKEV